LPLLTKNMITAWICALRNGGRCHGAVFLNCDDTRYGSLAVFLIGLRCLLTGPCTYPQNEYCRFFPNLGTNPVDWSYLNNLIREENRGNASYCKRGAGPGICSDPGGCGPAIHRASRNEATWRPCRPWRDHARSSTDLPRLPNCFAGGGVDAVLCQPIEGRAAISHPRRRAGSATNKRRGHTSLTLYPNRSQPPP